MSATLFTCVRVFDGVSDELPEGMNVLVADGLIQEISERPLTARDARVVDGGGRTLMPGLIDAHVHAYSPTFSFARNDRIPPNLLALHGGTTVSGMLDRGFTSVRDAGGGDHALALAIEQGVIRGPRFFFSGKALSQTGGHGDMRPTGEQDLCGCDGYVGSISRVVDGTDAVRSAVREQLRQGAHQIKLFVSGGVLSPADPIWMDQFTDEEIVAAVQEAATRRSYVMAHCHTDDSARRAIALGVRSLEHASSVGAETASLIALSGGFIVPTLTVVEVVDREGLALGLSRASMDKVSSLFESTYNSIETCRRAGVKIGLGSDLLGREHHRHQGRELALRGRVDAPIDVLRSATSINADLLQREDSLGRIAPGHSADLLLLDFDPLHDLESFADPQRNIPVVMKGGEFVRNAL